MRSIKAIAQEILVDWNSKGRGVNYAAKPYLDAMLTLDKLTDVYGLDSASYCVSYFLANASAYRGETAKRIKAELRGMLKDFYRDESQLKTQTYNVKRAYADA